MRHSPFSQPVIRLVLSFVYAMTVLAVGASAADRVPDDCPLRDAPFSLDSPVMDVLLSESAVAAVHRVKAGLLAQLPPQFMSTEAPSFAAIMSIKSLLAMGRVPDEQQIQIEQALAAVTVTDADRIARCRRYDAVAPVLNIPDSDINLLVFTKINGFDHGPSVTALTEQVQRLGQERGWGVTVTDNGAVFNDELLARFDVVVWNNNSGDVLTLSQRAAFERYIKQGGGFAGFHGAGGDSVHFWDWYVDELLGARFIGHPMEPQFQQASITVEPGLSGIAADAMPGWSMTEEWYSFASNPRQDGKRIVATLDEASYNPVDRFGRDLSMGSDHPIVWHHCVDDGRAFYSAIGHRPEVYQVPQTHAVLADGIAWAAGQGVSHCRAGLEIISTGASGYAAESLDRQRGTKYAALEQINRDNVAQLALAWTYHTGDLPTDAGMVSMQDAPLLIEDNLIICSVNRTLSAVDPGTGSLRWKYDPGGDRDLVRKCKGVGAWTDPGAPADAQCRTRLLMGTLDYRLVAIDARSGEPCADFGENGVVQMALSKDEIYPGEVWALSRPAVLNDTVVVGSSVADNQRVAAPSGRVMAFDARSGAFKWSFDPVPRDLDDPAVLTWGDGSRAPQNGGANVWSGMVVDEQLDLVYLPTTSPTVDFYGADRPGDNLYTDSVVALRGSTGEVVWHQQLVHHDIWDYDIPTPGILVDFPTEQGSVPALIQNTKQGLIFVFNRATGEPLVPIEERPVPQSGATPGEWLSPTQPFPVGMPILAKHGFDPETDAWGFTPIDEWLCRERARELTSGPIYTPVSEQGTILLPSASGGTDWGGGAWDPDSNVMVAGSNYIAMVVTNIPADQPATGDDAEIDINGAMEFANAGSPYRTRAEPLLSPLGAPCSEPPWARLTAVDMREKTVLWQVPLGDVSELAPFPIPWELGTPGVGAPLVTAGGLVFIGYSLDNTFRAFDLSTGEVLWKARLPAPANSQPQTYWYQDRQYVVVPAGGHNMFGTEVSDAVMAYRLP